MTTFRSNSGAFARKMEAVKRVLEKRLTAFAIILERDVKQSFGSPPPQPLKSGKGYRKNSTKKWKRAHHSRPGEPPYVQTGLLRTSITHDAPSRFHRRIGSGVGEKENPGYAHLLERGTPHGQMKARPYLRPALERWRSRFLPFLKTGELGGEK